MENPLFLITKAVKAKKKRLGGGGSSGFRISPFSQIGALAGEPNGGWSHSGFDVKVIDAITGNLAIDAATGFTLGSGSVFPFIRIPIDDAAATDLATTPASNIHNTTNTQTANIQLNANTDYDMEYEITISPSSLHGNNRQVLYKLNAIHDPSNLANNAIRSSGNMPLQDLVRSQQSSAFRYTNGITIAGGGNAINAGDIIIFEITATVSPAQKGLPPQILTTETVQNILSRTAGITDSMYLQISFV